MDRPVALRDARRALAQGRPQEGLRLFWWLAEQTHLPEQEYNEILDGLAQAYFALDHDRAAGHVFQYLGNYDRAIGSFDPGHPEDFARVEEARLDFVQAGRYYLDAERPAAAAICLERGGSHDRARLLWEKLLQERRLEAYHAALVSFNHGRCCEALGERQAARRSMIEAVHLLEQAADEFESAGMRERAFDCFQVLLAMGAREAGAFENLAEGYLNSIRILKEDNLRYYVLQYYEDFHRKAMEREEYHAAATLLREASDYCHKVGLPYDRHYQWRSADVWMRAAEAVIERGQPAELAENALLAAVDLVGTLGDFRQVAECYRRLAELPLEPIRRERYERIAKRSADSPPAVETQTAFPDYLRQEAAYPNVWYLDLIEWEQGGDFRDAAADLISSPEYPESIKRRALLCRLEVLAAEWRGPLNDDDLVKVALRLGNLTTYSALSPLETLYANRSERVRAATMTAIRSLFFKRSFRLLNRGLHDPHGAVRQQALEAVRALHFTHALDPLTRLYRDHRDAKVRLAALQSVGKISTPDAAEFLLEIVRHGEDQEATLARDLLAQLSHPEIGPLLARHAMAERTEARDRIIEILRRRGEVMP